MKKINETFPCIQCGATIPVAERTCRNHCPHCFTSVHVDGDIPGDRNTSCHGRMYPISYIYKTEGTKILFQCAVCGKQHRNKQAIDDETENLQDLIESYKKIMNAGNMVLQKKERKKTQKKKRKPALL